MQDKPSENHFQVRAYRHTTDPGGPGFPLGEMSVNSIICQPTPGELVAGPRVQIQGNAITGGGRVITRVEVSPDGGETFIPPQLLDAEQPGAWRRWQASLQLAPGSYEVAVRAWDSAANTQPEHPNWTPKGYANNSRHTVNFEVAEA